MASKPKINKMITKVNFSDSNRSAGQILSLIHISEPTRRS